VLPLDYASFLNCNDQERPFLPILYIISCTLPCVRFIAHRLPRMMRGKRLTNNRRVKKNLELSEQKTA